MRAIPRGSCRTRLGERDAFMREQPALALDAASVARERAVRADHAVTRNHDADGVRAVRQADRPYRLGSPDMACEITVRTRLPARYLQEPAPDRALEFRA